MANELPEVIHCYDSTIQGTCAVYYFTETLAFLTLNCTIILHYINNYNSLKCLTSFVSLKIFLLSECPSITHSQPTSLIIAGLKYKKNVNLAKPTSRGPYGNECYKYPLSNSYIYD